MWMAPRAEVVGGCGDDAANGGNDKDVGWRRASKGDTNEGKNDVDGICAAGASSSISTSETLSISSGDS